MWVQNFILKNYRILFVTSVYNKLKHVHYYFLGDRLHVGHIMLFCCIYLSHLKEQSLKILSD